jgi:hypothetical protein
MLYSRAVNLPIPRFASPLVFQFLARECEQLTDMRKSLPSNIGQNSRQDIVLYMPEPVIDKLPALLRS